MHGKKSEKTLFIVRKTGKTVKELAEAVGYRPESVSYALTGNKPMSVKLAMRLSQVTGLEYEFFLNLYA
jgi:hypothetical protein